MAGNHSFKNQDITFLPGRKTEVPYDFYKKYFDDYYQPIDKYLDFAITIKGKTYNTSRYDYSTYSSDEVGFL